MKTYYKPESLTLTDEVRKTAKDGKFIALPSGVITASYLDELRAMRKKGIPTSDEPLNNDNNQNQ